MRRFAYWVGYWVGEVRWWYWCGTQYRYRSDVGRPK